MTKYFIDADNNYIGGFEGEGAEPPKNAIEVPLPPDDARQKWNGSAWDALKVDERKSQSQMDKEDAILKIEDALSDATIPQKVREALAALKKIV